MDDSTSIGELTKRLEAIEAFIASPAYSSRQKTIQADLSALADSILDMPPVDERSRSDVLLLYGRRQQLSYELNFFEDARSILKSKLDDLSEPEQQGATTTDPVILNES